MKKKDILTIGLPIVIGAVIFAVVGQFLHLNDRIEQTEKNMIYRIAGVEQGSVRVKLHEYEATSESALIYTFDENGRAVFEVDDSDGFKEKKYAIIIETGLMEAGDYHRMEINGIDIDGDEKTIQKDKMSLFLSILNE